MAYDINEMNAQNTPARWKIQAKRMAEGGAAGAAEMAKLEQTYQDTLTKAATFMSDDEMGVGDQPGNGFVELPEEVVVPVPVTGITVSSDAGTDFDMIVDGVQAANLSAVVLPVDADDATVAYASDDELVVTVSPDYGLVSAVGVGTAIVTATANDGSGITDMIEFTVVDTTI